MGSTFHQQALGLSTWIRVVTAHGVHQGAIAALAIAHLHLQPGVDLRMVAPGFLSRVETPENIDVGQLIAKFGAAASTIVVVVNVDRVIKDTPR